MPPDTTPQCCLAAWAHNDVVAGPIGATRRLVRVAAGQMLLVRNAMVSGMAYSTKEGEAVTVWRCDVLDARDPQVVSPQLALRAS